MRSPIKDIAARQIARQFYLALAVGRTVRQAFEIGCEAVHTIPHMRDAAREKEKFLLLPEGGPHDALIFAHAPPGAWRDVTPILPPDNLPAVPEHFIGRNVDLQQVVASVWDERLVTVRGAPGIGKTALATAAARYLHARRAFRDGAFWVSLLGAASDEAARVLIASALKIQAKDDEELFAALRSRHCLLVLDNAEDPLHRAPRTFSEISLPGCSNTPGMFIRSSPRRQAVGGGLPGAGGGNSRFAPTRSAGCGPPVPDARATPPDFE